MRGIYLLAVLAACGAERRPGIGGADASGTGGDSSGNGGGDGGVTEQVYVYAHTASTLFKVDPDTLAITMIGNFGWPSSVGSDQMTDIAIDKTGQMIGVSFSRVYRVDPTTAHATLLSASLGDSFNGLSFVPAAQVGQTGDDVLVGTRISDGKVEWRHGRRRGLRHRADRARQQRRHARQARTEFVRGDADRQRHRLRLVVGHRVLEEQDLRLCRDRRVRADRWHDGRRHDGHADQSGVVGSRCHHARAGDPVVTASSG
jgi:hypothetical protein